MIKTPYQCHGVRVWNSVSKWLPGKKSMLSFDALLESATKTAGCSDFGDGTFFDPLRTLLESLNDSDDMHSFGRFYAKTAITGFLVNRLKLVQLWHQYPEISSEAIRQPLVILGLPRTGTSFLFNLLGQDPRYRFLSNWEVTVSQVPPAGHYMYEHDPRRKRGKKFMLLQNYLAPHMQSIHQFYLDGPEECTPLLMQEFTTLALVGMFNVPSYSEWLNTASQAPTYRHHKRIIQTLQWKYPKENWLLKSPAHIAAIEAIVEVYPDACVIQMHRDPVKSIPSYASLCAAFHGIHSNVINTKTIGEHVMERLGFDFERYLGQRQQCNEFRYIDFQYSELIQEPLAVARQIYRQFELTFSIEVEERMRAFLAKDKMKNKKSHHYTPEDFGLTSERIRHRFKNYIDAFNIPHEN